MLKPGHLEKCLYTFSFRFPQLPLESKVPTAGPSLLPPPCSLCNRSYKIPSRFSSWNPSLSISCKEFEPPVYPHCSHNKTQIPSGCFSKSSLSCGVEVGSETALAGFTLTLLLSLRFLCYDISVTTPTPGQASWAHQFRARHMQAISHETHRGTGDFTTYNCSRDSGGNCSAYFKSAL